MQNPKPIIKFRSFVAINRDIDREVFKDSKLFCLITYIALRVKRDDSLDITWGIKLSPGQFIIGRLSTSQDTDLTEAEYRTRFKKLQTLQIIEVLETTNRYTLGSWHENDYFDLNISSKQPTNDQVSTTTNNNWDISLINYINTNCYIPNTYTADMYLLVIKAYMACKGIEIKGEEIKRAIDVIDNMFRSGRKPQEIIGFMEWLKKVENSANYFVRFGQWNIYTIQSKLPEFLAGKLRYEPEIKIKPIIDMTK